VFALTGALDDGDVNVRAAAAIALGRIGPDAKEAVGKLTILLEDSTELIRWTAIIGLGGIGPAAVSAVPSLVHRLQDEAKNLRWAAMLALGSIGREATSTVPALVEFLSGQEEGVVGAATTLAKMGETAVPPLIEGMKSDKAHVRWTCAIALGRIGPSAKAAVPSLMTALSDPEQKGLYRVAEVAAEALGQIGPAAVSAIPALIDALRKSHISMQFPVAKALKEIGPEHAIAWLIPLLAEEKARWGASHVLTEIGAAAVPDLIALLMSGNLSRHHASSAIRTLGWIGSSAMSAVPVLIRLLRDDDSFVRCEAVKALATIQDR
jgi:HEAT repeat protein